MTGAGPSRRSHTKSRTGCKTCKRRHIRCDELFPQCRNCTKHQVRCDYMDSTESELSSQRSSVDERSVSVSSTAEDEIEVWKQTGVFPFANLEVYPTPRVFDLTKDELRLLHHLCSVSSDLMVSETANLTVWTEKVPKFLSIASSFPFVMHALLSFSANHLAWTQSSQELRALQVQHGGVALRGLHEAIGNFSPVNADAILAASMLMCWQSTEWLSYSSLLTGVHSVLSIMPPQNRDRFMADVFPRESTNPPSPTVTRAITLEERSHILQNFIDALKQLQLGLFNHELESHWVEQLISYMHRLQTIPPARTAEQQFQHAYMLRKWMYWVPVSLLRRPGSKGPSVLVLAYLYAASIALQPLFPDLTLSFGNTFATFPTSFSIPPLEAIIQMTDAVSFSSGHDTSSAEIASLIHYARQTFSDYRNRQSQGAPYLNEINLNAMLQAGNMSPAFTPAPLSYTPTLASNVTYLGVPQQAGFTYVSDNWGVVPSPGFPPLHHDSFGSYDSTEELYPVSTSGTTSMGYPRPDQQ